MNNLYQLYPFVGEVFVDRPGSSFTLPVYRFYMTSQHHFYRQSLDMCYDNQEWDPVLGWSVVYDSCVLASRLPFEAAYEYARDVLLKGVLGVDEDHRIIFNSNYRPHANDPRYARLENNNDR